MRTVTLATNKYILSILILCTSFLLTAQKKAGDKLYDKAQYYKAIPKYQQAIKVNDKVERQKSLIKLAECYSKLNDYRKAEVFYKLALEISNVSPDINYDYANVLKYNNNYSEAINNYLIYLESKPDDQKATHAFKSCQEIKYWQSNPQEYQVKNIEAINTMRSEFCPTMLNNKLIYTAEKQSDYLEYNTNNLNGQPYLNVYYAQIDNNKFKKSKLFSARINSSFHDGPVSFSADETTLYLTRVNNVVSKKNKNFVNRGKLYISTGKNKRWSTLKPFQYNSDEYSCAHACVSADDSTLYFASDMPGGMGGKDIWMCKRNGGEWDKPVNLGLDINTSGDEMFPYINKDDVLYFSSNGLPGFGGLDILSAKQNDGRWILNRNEGLLLNSSADDFGIVFTSDSTGYFSSNRLGGKGDDDIYAFTYSNKYTTVDGIVLQTQNANDPAKNVKVYLLDNKEVRLDSTRTNQKGYFAFKNLDADKIFMAQIEADALNMKNKARYFLADKNFRILRVTHENSRGQKFVFRNLPIELSEVPDLYTDDDLNLAGNLLSGENPSKPIANKSVIIKNEFGDILEVTTTNAFGAFAFRNLPFDQNYYLTIVDDDLPLDSKITLTNKTGKIVKFTRSDSKGNFKFLLLNSDKDAIADLAVSEQVLIMAVSGYLYDQDKKPVNNAQITIFNNAETIANVITDESGNFLFKNLGSEKNYVFSVEELDGRSKHITKLYLADSEGKIYREIMRNSSGKFKFEMLELDKTAMGDYTVDDPWITLLNMKAKQTQQTITIIENLYYAYGDYKIDAAGFNILDKVVLVLNANPKLNIELSSHTDSRSTELYNLNLSQKRANAAVDYIISKGIKKTRLKAVGYGETKLLNKCKNQFPCSEDDHAKNRRTEFKIVEL